MNDTFNALCVKCFICFTRYPSRYKDCKLILLILKSLLSEQVYLYFFQMFHAKKSTTKSIILLTQQFGNIQYITLTLSNASLFYLMSINKGPQ